MNAKENSDWEVEEIETEDMGDGLWCDPSDMS